MCNFRAPAQLPSFEQLLTDLGHPDAPTLARFLDVSIRTVYGWKKAGACPRPVRLALFYESTWGQSLVATDAANGAMYARNLAASLEREAGALRARIARLEKIADFGAANAPTLQAPGPIGAVALP